MTIDHDIMIMNVNIIIVYVSRLPVPRAPPPHESESGFPAIYISES